MPGNDCIGGCTGLVLFGTLVTGLITSWMAATKANRSWQNCKSAMEDGIPEGDCPIDKYLMDLIWSLASLALAGVLLLALVGLATSRQAKPQLAQGMAILSLVVLLCNGGIAFRILVVGDWDKDTQSSSSNASLQAAWEGRPIDTIKIACWTLAVPLMCAMLACCGSVSGNSNSGGGGGGGGGGDGDADEARSRLALYLRLTMIQRQVEEEKKRRDREAVARVVAAHVVAAAVVAAAQQPGEAADAQGDEKDTDDISKMA